MSEKVNSLKDSSFVIHEIYHMWWMQAIRIKKHHFKETFLCLQKFYYERINKYISEPS